MKKILILEVRERTISIHRQYEVEFDKDNNIVKVYKIKLPFKTWFFNFLRIHLT